MVLYKCCFGDYIFYCSTYNIGVGRPVSWVRVFSFLCLLYLVIYDKLATILKPSYRQKLVGLAQVPNAAMFIHFLKL